MTSEQKTLTIMTVEEAAEYLKVPVFTIRQLARTKRIPAVKIGREWRIPKEELDKMLTKRIF